MKGPLDSQQGRLICLQAGAFLECVLGLTWRPATAGQVSRLSTAGSFRKLALQSRGQRPRALPPAPRRDAVTHDRDRDLGNAAALGNALLAFMVVPWCFTLALYTGPWQALVHFVPPNHGLSAASSASVHAACNAF